MFSSGQYTSVRILYADVSEHRYIFIEDGRVFRNVGIYNSYAGELHRTKHTTLRTRRKFEIKKSGLDYWQRKVFLCSFSKLRKQTIRFVMSVRPHGTNRLPLNGFSRNSIFKYFPKICLRKFKFY
jgi:hypothetical protein